MRILALEVGSASIKAAVLDTETTRPLGAVHRLPYDLDQPTPEAAEIEAERLWQVIVAAARLATRHVDGVEGVGLACMTPALVLLDRADRPLGPIRTPLDRRSRPAARQAWAALGEEYLATAGSRPLPGGISAVCYKQQVLDDSYTHTRVKSYLHLNGWLALRLSGERVIDPANASLSGLFTTLTDRRWSSAWCDYFEVDPAWLPPIVDGAATVGHLRSAAAAELGVPAGLPLKMGSDVISTALLAADLEPDELLHGAGATQVLAGLTDKPRPHPARLTFLAGVGPFFCQLTHNHVGSAALDWMRSLCFADQSEETFFEQTIPSALEHRTGVVLDPPYLGGDPLEIEAHRAGFRNLSLSTQRLDLLVALLASMRREHERAVADLGLGSRFRRVVLTGDTAEMVRRLMPGYAEGCVEVLSDGALRGVARLFAPGKADRT